MSMNTYTLNEAAVLLIHGSLTAAIHMTENHDTRAISELSAGELLDYQEIGDVEALSILQDKNLDCICHCSEFTGTAVSLYDEHVLNKDNPYEISFEDDMIVTLLADKTPGLFHTAYQNFDEIETEFREKLKGLIHDDFPLKHYIMRLSGTYYA